jgi:hypothetical protein
MKKPMLFCGGLLLLVLAAYCQQQREASREELLAFLNSRGFALYVLARERFIAHEARNETWILSVRRSVDPASLKKFTDGKHVVVSLPALDFEEHGLRIYASQCNALTTRKADLLAMGGKPSEALTIYRLLRRFDSSDAAGVSEMEARIKCAEKLARNEEVETQLAKLKELTTNYGSCAAERFEMIQAVFRTNLLHVDFEASGESAAPR